MPLKEVSLIPKASLETRPWIQAWPLCRNVQNTALIRNIK